MVPIRFLFSSVPSPGHVLPLMPLADAATAAGHATALMTSPEWTHLAAPVPVLPVDPRHAELAAEAVRRTGSPMGQPGPTPVEYFTAVRLDLSFDEAVDRARAFGPDVLVCDALDYVGPAVSAALDLPWVAHGISGGLPAPFADALAERSAAWLSARSLTARPRLAYLDPYPDRLRRADEPVEPDRVIVRPEPNRHGGPPAVLPDRQGRARVLVTFGTVVSEPAALATVVGSVLAEGFDVVLTVAADQLPYGVDRQRVHAVGFAPLATLLPHVDAVVTAGGTGTLLAALAVGLPIVLRPFMADQPWNAQRAAAAGLASVLEQEADAGRAVRHLLDDPDARRAARSAASSIAAMDPPEQVLELVLTRVRGVDAG